MMSKPYNVSEYMQKKSALPKGWYMAKYDAEDDCEWEKVYYNGHYWVWDINTAHEFRDTNFPHEWKKI